MKHTKEPWWVVGIDDMYEIHSDSDDVVWSIDQEANAKRIVACVNACVGITNEALEAGIVKKALVAYLGSYDKSMTLNNMKVWEDV